MRRSGAGRPPGRSFVRERATRPAGRLTALWALAVLLPAPASASPTTVTLEGGAEVDDNVQRVETGPGLDTTRIAAPVARLGARFDRRGRAFGGQLAVSAGGLARVIVHPDTAVENAALLVGDARWLRRVGARPVLAGVGLTAADAVALTDDVGARTFRTLGADGLLVLRGGEDRTLTLAAGGRSFTFKPLRDFDWIAPSLNARLDLILWQAAGGTRSVELAATLGFEARAYASNALANICVEDAPPSTDCFAGTSLRRRDRFQRAGVELTWVGRAVAAAGYQLTVVDSNSFGQSLVRHRVNVSATLPLPAGVIGTALATLQLDTYLDGQLIRRDLQQLLFTTLDDENRSSLQLRLARPVSEAWSVETRGAVWRDFGGSMDTSFARALLYGGLVYSK